MLKLSIGSINQTLKLLLELGVVTRDKKGNVFLYSLNSDNYLLKYFKIFDNLIYIHNFVQEVRPYAYEIILYGSCAEGANTENSDIDIFIKTEYKSRVRKIVNKYRAIDDSFKAVILDSLEIASSTKIDKVFHNEIKKGIVLWRGKPVYEEL
jgi:predicted nucleotidyltransferase